MASWHDDTEQGGTPAPVVGIRSRERRRQAERSGSMAQNLEIARQCEGAADAVAAEFPIAARLLRHESEKWRGYP